MFLTTVRTNTGDTYGVIEERVLCAPLGEIVATNHPEETGRYESFVRRASGRVLLLGLGLGMMVNALLRKPEVEGITVFEVDPEIAAWGQEQFYGERVEILCRDAWCPMEMQFDCGFASIWNRWHPDIWPEMDRIRRLYRPYLREKLFCDNEIWVKDQLYYNAQVPKRCLEPTTPK